LIRFCAIGYLSIRQIETLQIFEDYEIRIVNLSSSKIEKFSDIEYEFGDSSIDGVAFNSIPLTTISGVSVVCPRQRISHLGVDSNKSLSLLLQTPFITHKYFS
jgi:hypothetical protein